jgi:hypothetical protein
MLDGDWAAPQKLGGSWFRETRGGAYGPRSFAIGKAQTTDSNIATGIAVIAPFDTSQYYFRS